LKRGASDQALRAFAFGRRPFLRYVSEMNAEHQTRAKCQRCGLPFVEIDAYGERLRGCLGCNQWWDLLSGELRRPPDEDMPP
jgi:hypothetical protein